MRLLNTTTLEFQEFLGHNIPRYAILSHRWSAEEVSYKEYVLTRRPLEQLPPCLQDEVATIKQRTGYRKILSFAAQAQKDVDHAASWQEPIEWCWIDTCCIDKSSSAELSEAINSMWAWYKSASACLVYLADVRDKEDMRSNREEMARSQWFKRAWTLQEFIAPWKLTFYDRSWSPLLFLERSGTPGIRGFASWALQDTDAVRDLASYTGIPPECVLKDAGPWLYTVPIANRMSWAASRSATRTEDLAYSLMGIFNVNMPLLYGEGAKAFIRLQHELLRNGYDDSIFAWWDVCRMLSRDQCTGKGRCCTNSLLAPHPRYFDESQGFSTVERRSVATMSHVEANVECPASRVSDPENHPITESLSSFEGLVQIRLDFQQIQREAPHNLIHPCLTLLVRTSSQAGANGRHAQTVVRRLGTCNRKAWTVGELGQDLRIARPFVDNGAFEPAILRIPIGLDQDHA